jgi:DNA-binding CsgD family transcriptional regulator
MDEIEFCRHKLEEAIENDDITSAELKRLNAKAAALLERVQREFFDAPHTLTTGGPSSSQRQSHIYAIFTAMPMQSPICPKIDLDLSVGFCHLTNTILPYFQRALMRGRGREYNEKEGSPISCEGLAPADDQLNGLWINGLDTAEPILGRLTHQERRIAWLVAEGLSNREISRQLNIREGTVKVHLHHIYAKLSIANRTSLAVLAARYEWVSRSM